MSELGREPSAAVEHPPGAGNNCKNGTLEHEKCDAPSNVPKHRRRRRAASVVAEHSTTSSTTDQNAGRRIRVKILPHRGQRAVSISPEPSTTEAQNSSQSPGSTICVVGSPANSINSLSPLTTNDGQHSPNSDATMDSVLVSSQPSTVNGNVGSTARRITASSLQTPHGEELHSSNNGATMTSVFAASRMQSQMMAQYAVPTNHGVASYSNHGFAPMAGTPMQPTSSNTPGPSSMHAATVPPNYAGVGYWCYQPHVVGSFSQMTGNEYNVHMQYGSCSTGVDSSTLSNDWISSTNAANHNTANYNSMPTPPALSDCAVPDDHNMVAYPQCFGTMTTAPAQQHQQAANGCNTHMSEMVSSTVAPPAIFVIDPHQTKKKEKLPPLLSPSGTVIKRPRGRPRKYPRPEEDATPSEMLRRVSEEQMEYQLREHERNEQMQEPIDLSADEIDLSGNSENGHENGDNSQQTSSRTLTEANNSNNNGDEMRKTRLKRPRIKKSIINLVCVNCGTRNTTLWRRNEDNLMECNACSLYFRLNNRSRPLALVKDTISRRNRVSSKKPWRMQANEVRRQHQIQQEAMMQQRMQYVPITAVGADGVPHVLMVNAQQVQIAASQLQQQQAQVGATAQYVNYLMANRQDIRGTLQHQPFLIPKAEPSSSCVSAAAILSTSAHAPQTHFLQTHFERYGQDAGCSYVVPNAFGGAASTSAMPSYPQMAMPGVALVSGSPNSI